MALTGRAGLLALLGALVVGFLLPSMAGIALVTGVILLAIVVDLALAGPVRALSFTRGGDRMVADGRAGHGDADGRQSRSPGPRSGA